MAERAAEMQKWNQKKCSCYLALLSYNGSALRLNKFSNLNTRSSNHDRKVDFDEPVDDCS